MSSINELLLLLFWRNLITEWVIVGFRRFDVCSAAWGDSELIGVVLPRGQRYNLGLPGWAPSSFGTACTHWRRSCFSPITTCITPGVKLSMWSTIELKQECIFRSNRLYYFNSMVSSSCFVCNSLLGRWRQPGFAGRSWASWGRWTWVWERARECCRHHVEDELPWKLEVLEDWILQRLPVPSCAT